MESKKGAYANSGSTPTSEAVANEAVPKHVHQHNTAPQHLRLLQYGLKIPNHQHSQLNQPSPHQHQPPPVTPHVHQHHSQATYQPPPVHQHLQPSLHQHQSNTPNVYQNQMIHHQQYVHQHQQKHQTQQNQTSHQNHFHYQGANQQPPLHSHNINQLNHQNAQIWVPHQPPGHYHPPQQLKPEPQTHLHSNKPSQPSKPKDIERKKSSGNSNQQLRSPSAKRPPEAPVAIQGWLHKQGSDGLMLWKKRWFVLSEYCLFYYKGPEEEKLLGSILLPSYRVSICGPDDKVNRKYAFKCEHANMRTYILAADSQELMMQWVRLLNMACLLQNNNETERQVNQSPLTPNPPAESPRVRQQQSVQTQNLRNTPVHMHSSSNTTDLSNPSQQELGQYSQPLYANAPPKPRRLTDGYSSPSSELDRYSGESKYVTLQQPHQYNVQPIYGTRATTKSPINVYGNPQVLSEYLQGPLQQQIYNKHLHIPEYGVTSVRDNHNVERRTPDTYGRSKLNPTKGTHPSDYEDVYADQSMYKRPLSPMAYTSNNRLNPALSVPAARSYTPMRGPKDNLPYIPLQQLQKIPNTIPRPHSADFLEYEIKHQNSNVIARQPRPKSSLDINRHPSNDNYFYTEERYAEKMRKSAQYLPKMSKHPCSQSEYATHQQKWPAAFNSCEPDNTFPLTRSNTRPTNFNDSNLHDFCHRESQPIRSRSVLSDGSLSKEVDMDLQPSPHERYDKEAISPAFRSRQEQIYGYSDDLRRTCREYDQFTRSASARLAHNSSQLEGRSVNREGDRKREESMKRLLEWKQRMLQSPLNRKVNQGGNRGVVGKFNPYYRTNENGYPPVPNLDMYPDTQRPTNTMPQYNSYSSDDEENEDGSKENVQTQAGRTTDTYPSISEPHIPALTASTTEFNSLPMPDETSISPDTTHDTARHSNTVKTLPVVCTRLRKFTSEKVELEVNQEGDIFEKPLKIATNNSTHTALVSSLRSEFSNKFEKSPTVTEIKSNGALVRSILAEFEKKLDTQGNSITNNSQEEDVPSTPVKDVESIVEENYMTMTPKKSILEPHKSHSSLAMIVNSDVDENPYVEMTQGSDISLLEPNSDNVCISELQAYETVCFSDRKMEPVYVELNQLVSGKKNVFGSSSSKPELPDILIASQKNNKNNSSSKSDSSDADDEASKDLDSLDTPCHPRFSLSDTFRPASYYLGASRVAPEHQDSSDSELVSPPPIPTSPPPLDDLDNTDECVSISQDVSLTEQDNKGDMYRYNLQTSRNSDFLKQTMTSSSTPVLDSKKPIIYTLNGLIDQDISSFYSINTDTDRRYSSRLSHNSDSDVEMRTPLSNTSDYERMLKRRPVSEEFYDKLELLSARPNETIDSFDLDRHLKHLEASNVAASLYNRSDANKDATSHGAKRSMQGYHDYENMYVNSQLEKEVKIVKDNSNSPVNKFLLGNVTTLSPVTTYTHSRENSRDTVSSQLTVNTYKSDSGSRRSTFSPNDFVSRARPESSSSVTAEMSGFLSSSSPHLTPVVRAGSSVSIQEINSASFFFSGNTPKQLSLNSFSNQPAPYYYSDLSINTSRTDSTSSILTLNNQRCAMSGSKRDITHIVNPIRCNNRTRNSIHSPHRNLFDATCKLAAEARSASVDFLNIADKSGNIDKKNIYESDTLKRLKATDSASSLQTKSEVQNLYPGSKNDKFSRSDASTSEANVRRSYSLEGLLENVLNENIPTPQEFNSFSGQIDLSASENTVINTSAEGSHMWEEDSIWHERLRSASQRHTRSLDDLDCIRESDRKPKRQARGISRLVTYVNDNMLNMPIQDKQQMELEDKKEENNKSETKETGSFTIDREKLRQWDFLSSAPSDAQSFTQSPSQGCINSVVDLGAGVSACEPSEQNSVQHQASGSISLTTRDTFPRSVPAKKTWTTNSKPVQSKSTTNLSKGYENDYTGSRRPQQGYFMSQGPSQHDLSSDTSQSSNSRRANWQLGDKMNVSAGELLGRTHEELVLLLIQLRRQSANNCHAIEACYSEIDSIQSKLPKMDAAKRLENLQKLEQIKQHLLELEKQYEKGKPLVNLVDNMVKLGSLYRFPKDHNNYPYVKDRLEFNQQIQERRLLAEERRDWNRLSPNHTELQAKVQQLYQLDRLIQEESETLQGLQQDKEEIERALGGLRHRLIKGFKDPAEVEQARKQQIILENELSRVHSMLAQNSRKLEETVAGNARLEQELLVLKQKLQISRQQRSSPQISNAGDSLPCVIGTSAMLESDLHRVQQKVGDLQRQRQELSMQVRQLTDRSNSLQQSRPSSATPVQVTQGNKKRMNSLWRETDLDTMSSVDHGESWDNPTASPIPVAPLYINTNVKHNQESDFYNRGFKSSDSASDDTLQNQNTMPQEKQEIKTVRIVKRESERRQRDREKTVTGKWDMVVEEEDSSQSSSVLFRPAPVQKTQSSTNLEMLSPNNSELDISSSGVLSRQSSLSNPSLPQVYFDARTAASANVEGSLDKSSELSPIFKSEAARQIIIEMSTHDAPQQTNRRMVPKEKRRHYTAPHNNLIMKSLNQLPTDDRDFDKLDISNVRRARDDLDMERALRQRIDAPDVVRSTLSNKELKYNESTIDNILGTPNKIFIPERYVPEQLPQLSAEEQQHRLRKVESIKKMLSDTTIISGSSANLASDETNPENPSSSITSKATSKMMEEKKQREHLLQLNQILAKQVMEMSKIVAVKALASLPLESERLSSDEEDLSPDTPLPIYQQRDNFYS